eukprot:2655985-Amphidinium_carterae.1
MLIALSICPGWMIANYLFNLSLDMTSVVSVAELCIGTRNLTTATAPEVPQILFASAKSSQDQKEKRTEITKNTNKIWNF